MASVCHWNGRRLDINKMCIPWSVNPFPIANKRMHGCTFEYMKMDVFNLMNGQNIPKILAWMSVIERDWGIRKHISDKTERDSAWFSVIRICTIFWQYVVWLCGGAGAAKLPKWSKTPVTTKILNAPSANDPLNRTLVLPWPERRNLQLPRRQECYFQIV